MFSVQPWTLEAMAGRCDRAADDCSDAARLAASVDLPPRAFGGVTHSTRLYALCTSFRDTIGDEGAALADDATQQSVALTAAAGAYRAGDEEAAGSYLSLQNWF